MTLSKVLDDLYGRPDEFLKRLRSELLLHRKTIYQLWAATHVDCRATYIIYFRVSKAGNRSAVRSTCDCTSGLDQATVYKYFQGKRRPTTRTCIRLDEAMRRLIS